MKKEARTQLGENSWGARPGICLLSKKRTPVEENVDSVCLKPGPYRCGGLNSGEAPDAGAPRAVLERSAESCNRCHNRGENSGSQGHRRGE